METDGGKRIEQVFLQGAVNACSRTSPSVFATWDGWILDEEREREKTSKEEKLRKKERFRGGLWLLLHLFSSSCS